MDSFSTISSSSSGSNGIEQSISDSCIGKVDVTVDPTFASKFADKTALERAVRSMLVCSSFRCVRNDDKTVRDYIDPLIADGLLKEVPVYSVVRSIAHRMMEEMEETDRMRAISYNIFLMDKRENHNKFPEWKIKALNLQPTDDNCDGFFEDTSIYWKVYDSDKCSLHGPIAIFADDKKPCFVTYPLITREIFNRYGPYSIIVGDYICEDIINDSDIVAACIDADKIFNINCRESTIPLVVARAQYLKQFHPDLWLIFICYTYRIFFEHVYHIASFADINTEVLKSCLTIFPNEKLEAYLKKHGKFVPPVSVDCGLLAHYRLHLLPKPTLIYYLGIPTNTCIPSDENIERLMSEAFTNPIAYLAKLKAINKSRLEHLVLEVEFTHGKHCFVNTTDMLMYEVEDYNPIDIVRYADDNGRIFQFTRGEFEQIVDSIKHLNPYTRVELPHEIVGRMGSIHKANGCYGTARSMDEIFTSILGPNDWNTEMERTSEVREKKDLYSNVGSKIRKIDIVAWASEMLDIYNTFQDNLKDQEKNKRFIDIKKKGYIGYKDFDPRHLRFNSANIPLHVGTYPGIEVIEDSIPLPPLPVDTSSYNIPSFIGMQPAESIGSHDTSVSLATLRESDYHPNAMSGYTQEDSFICPAPTPSSNHVVPRQSPTTFTGYAGVTGWESVSSTPTPTRMTTNLLRDMIPNFNSSASFPAQLCGFIGLSPQQTPQVPTIQHTRGNINFSDTQRDGVMLIITYGDKSIRVFKNKTFTKYRLEFHLYDWLYLSSIYEIKLDQSPGDTIESCIGTDLGFRVSPRLRVQEFPTSLPLPQSSSPSSNPSVLVSLPLQYSNSSSVNFPTNPSVSSPAPLPYPSWVSTSLANPMLQPVTTTINGTVSIQASANPGYVLVSVSHDRIIHSYTKDANYRVRKLTTIISQDLKVPVTDVNLQEYDDLRFHLRNNHALSRCLGTTALFTAVRGNQAMQLNVINGTISIPSFDVGNVVMKIGEKSELIHIEQHAPIADLRRKIESHLKATYSIANFDTSRGDPIGSTSTLSQYRGAVISFELSHQQNSTLVDTGSNDGLLQAEIVVVEFEGRGVDILFNGRSTRINKLNPIMKIKKLRSRIATALGLIPSNIIFPQTDAFKRSLKDCLGIRIPFSVKM